MKFEGVVPTTAPVSVSKFSNGHWRYFKQMREDKAYVGFIYAIYDKALLRFYIGKKNYFSTGKATFGRESDWKRYKSSSSTIAAHLKERPAEEFLYICLGEYKTKSGLAWAETWSLVTLKAPFREDVYNKRIEEITWKVTEDVAPHHIERLNLISKGYIPNDFERDW
jgi:hypothetical protein